jgi:hypothetical protein
MSLSKRFHVWFQHDGASSHYVNEVRLLLMKIVLEAGLVKDVKIQCHAPPSQLTYGPFDLFLWGYFKTQIYASAVDTGGELRL